MRRWTIGNMIVIAFLTHAVLGTGVSVADRARPVRIGALTASWGPTPMIVGMRDGLLKLGYREDVDFVLGVRFTQGDIQALGAAARELVQYGVDLLFVDLDEPALAAQQATTQIPIVFAGVADPIGMGLAQSFAQPGGNVTGVTDMELHLGPKRLQMFKEMIPPLQRVLFPYDPADAYAVAMSKVYREAAEKLGADRKSKRYFSAADREHNPENALGAYPFPPLTHAPSPRRGPRSQRSAAARAAARRQAWRGHAPPGPAIPDRCG